MRVWRLALCVMAPLVVGGISGLITANGMAQYDGLRQPVLSPPGWLFPIMWTLLYVMMGVASYLILVKWQKRGTKEEKTIKRVMAVYWVQLFFNFGWSIIFFGLGWYWAAFVWLMLMWLMIVYLVMKTWRVERRAMWLLVPYLAWTTFAAYLNLSFAILN